VPVVAGLNVTDIVQVALLPASVVPQGAVPPATAAKFPLAPNESDVLAVPVFLTVTIFAALVVPTVCAANVSLVGVTVTMTVPAEAPVPERFTVCGELDAWSVIEIEPVRVPVVVGVNVMFTVQFAPAPSVLMQVVLDCAKSPVGVPMESVVDPVPELATVNDMGALVVPTVCDGNVKLVGEGVTMTVVPVPDRVTLCGDVDELSVIVMVPGRLPLAVGVKVTLMVQVTPPANVVPQLFVWP
jgi:hypothetical protein